ncbi:conserved phage C-terminal domain-containing protein [Bacillus sp. FJAT-27245]|uniref:conserved phage C-terminal domain-containing protein n=1 Tax=Bacillus sp. FJAT-27245 TaxID=1684144 RepID=UPI0006A7E85C|nr:conserved phage C-terminal domain-containing protein [Bacillus sp. FJAT-27245]
MSSLLINDCAMMVSPSLAAKIGLNEAIVLRQLHYLLEKNQHMIEGRSWIYNTYSDWQKQFPFWSESTIKRIFKSLKDLGYVVTGNFNKYKIDQTKWYTIDYEQLNEVAEEGLQVYSGEEHSLEKKEAEEEVPVAEVIEYLNKKTYSAFRADNRRTMKFVQDRWKEGYRLTDFKKVIDKKADEWLDHPKWSFFLRPETLFGPKFQKYLKQKRARRKGVREEDFAFYDEEWRGANWWQ